jgi:hypothetical protein
VLAGLPSISEELTRLVSTLCPDADDVFERPS